MNCENFEQLIGMRCNPVGDAVGVVSTLLGVAAWEREQAGISQDASWLVDEVAMYMKQWKPHDQ
jgi:hypothetical protein